MATFRQVTNRTWCDGPVVLAGDAAHTTHFTIGSGTKLAMQDAMTLAEVLPAEAERLPAALRSYDERRRAALQPIQSSAHRSMTWFEEIDGTWTRTPTGSGSPSRSGSAAATARLATPAAPATQHPGCASCAAR